MIAAVMPYMMFIVFAFVLLFLAFCAMV